MGLAGGLASNGSSAGVAGATGATGAAGATGATGPPGATASSRYAQAMALGTAIGVAPTFTDQGAQTLPGSGALISSTQQTLNAATSGVINASAPWRLTGQDVVAISGTGRVGSNSQTTSTGRAPDSAFPYRVEFDFDGQLLALNVLTTVNTTFRVWANETVSAAQNGFSGSVSKYIMLDFGSTAYRRVVLDFDNGTYFYGLLFPKTTSVMPPSSRNTLKFAEVGDSYTCGTGAESGSAGGGVSSYLGYHNILARLLGFTDHRMYGQSGTGFLKDNGTLFRYRSRIADVIAYAPDYLLLRGTVNDRFAGGLGTIGPEVITYVNLLKASLPNVKIAMTSPLDVTNTASASGNRTLSADYSTAAATLGIPYIDACPSATGTVPTPNWFYGTGKVGTTVGDGNADLYQSSFTAGHPSLGCHQNFLGPALAGPLAAAWGIGL